MRLHFDHFIRHASGGALHRRQILLQPSHVASRSSEIRFQDGQRSSDSGRLLEQKLVLLRKIGRIVRARTTAAVRLNGSPFAGRDGPGSRAARSDAHPVIVSGQLTKRRVANERRSAGRMMDGRNFA